MTEGGDRLLNLEQVRKRLGDVSRRTVEREHRRGKIAFVKVGGSTFVWESELQRYLAAAERKTAA